jgi:hypothetical protein
LGWSSDLQRKPSWSKLKGSRREGLGVLQEEGEKERQERRPKTPRYS